MNEAFLNMVIAALAGADVEVSREQISHMLWQEVCREWPQANRNTRVKQLQADSHHTVSIMQQASTTPPWYMEPNAELDPIPTSYTHRRGVKAKLWRLVGDSFNRADWYRHGVYHVYKPSPEPFTEHAELKRLGLNVGGMGYPIDAIVYVTAAYSAVRDLLLVTINYVKGQRLL